MAKRFTATEKWIDPWFCGLSNNYRMFWVFLLDNCDHAGIWQINIPLVRFYFGNDFELPDWPDRVIKLNDTRWFIPKFLDFQYGSLDPHNRVHQSVLKVLEKQGASKVLTRSLLGAKDKDKEKASNKD